METESRRNNATKNKKFGKVVSVLFIVILSSYSRQGCGGEKKMRRGGGGGKRIF